MKRAVESSEARDLDKQVIVCFCACSIKFRLLKIHLLEQCSEGINNYRFYRATYLLVY